MVPLLFFFSIHFFNFSEAAEIKVQLFGQPCLLTDSESSATSRLTENQLKAIHSVSPEQLPPPTNADEAKKLKTKIQASGKLPSSLDSYRESTLKRIEGLIVFFQAANKFKLNKNTAQFLGSIKPHLNGKRVKNFERELKTFLAKTSPAKIAEPMMEELRDYYEENSKFPTTTVDEEFHRAIARMNVRYQCTFEEIDEEEGVEEESET